MASRSNRRVSAAVTAAVVLAACGGAASDTPASAQSAQPSGTPPVVAPTAGDGPVGRDTIWRVVVTDLVVRSEPGVADPGTVRAARLNDGDRVVAVDGPVAADGYEWYQVLPLRPDGLRQRPFGWVAAASRDGEAWLERVELSCPDPAQQGAGFLRLAPEERLACYGGESIVVRASTGGCGAGGGFPVSFEPSWLMGEGGCGLGLEPGEVYLALRFRPGASQDLGPGPTIQVRGHFDDPAAATCVGRANFPDVTPPSKAEAVALCRTQFVVEDVMPVAD